MSEKLTSGAELADCPPAEQAILEALCGPAVSVAVVRPDDISPELLPEETAAITSALDTRRREFAVGRTCARMALAGLCMPAVAIPVLPNRAPAWPAGITGSITHTAELVCAAVARRSALESIGIDVESRARPLRAKLEKYICTPAERSAWAELPTALDWLRLVFSAKESVHKCVAPVSGVTLGFHDVELDIDLGHETFRARLVGTSQPALPDLALLQGRFAVSEHFVLTTVSLPVEE